MDKIKSSASRLTSVFKRNDDGLRSVLQKRNTTSSKRSRDPFLDGPTLEEVCSTPFALRPQYGQARGLWWGAVMGFKMFQLPLPISIPAFTSDLYRALIFSTLSPWVTAVSSWMQPWRCRGQAKSRDYLQRASSYRERLTPEQPLSQA
jgi:hypothetical protein